MANFSPNNFSAGEMLSLARVDRFVCTQEIYWTQKRLESARDELRRARESLTVQERTHNKSNRSMREGYTRYDSMPEEMGASEHELRLQRDIEERLAEADAAEKAHTDAVERRNRLRRQILDE